MRKRAAGHRLCALLLLWATPAFAAGGDQRDVGRGETLARSWCAECHAVARGDTLNPRPGVPSFAAIARQPATTETSLHAFLTTSHPRMPNIKLTPGDLDDIVAYILSLGNKQ